MSATPPNFPNVVPATPTAGATPLKKRRGCHRVCVDGRAKGYLNGANSPKEDTTGTLHYVTAVCSTKSGNSF
jgi:hypothetical protein